MTKGLPRCLLPSMLAALAAAVASCSTAAGAGHHRGATADSAAAPSVTAAARQPLPAATARRLPAGVFYLTAGDPSGFSYGVWQVSATGGQKLLLRSGPGRDNGPRELAASGAGIIAVVASTGIDYLARIRAGGPDWLPHGRPQLHGFDPAIAANGEIAYDTPPFAARRYWAICTQPSFSARATIIYRQSGPIGTTTFGPHRQIATFRSLDTPQPPKQTPRVVIISPGGRTRTLRTGYPAIADLIWGPRAPAIAVLSMRATAELLFPNGRRMPLPAGWYPYTWNPAGTLLLMLGAGPRLGTWSPNGPHRVTVIGKISHGIGIGQVSWLSHPART